MLDGEDWEGIMNERVPLKLLRIHDAAREGFILTDFPR